MARLKYDSLERVPCGRPVDKFEWIAAACGGRSVLDLGAYDETAVEAKQGTPWWTHGRIAEVARSVIGVDNSDAIPADGLVTSPRSRIIRGDVLDLATVDLDDKPDVIVAGELIEHLPDPVRFVRAIARTPAFSGATLILTTPNAACAYNVLAGLAYRECMHRDHVAIHSFKTLNTICRKAGLEDWDIIPHFTRFPEMTLSSRGLRRLGVVTFTRVVNLIEGQFPLLAGGWIVAAQL